MKVYIYKTTECDLNVLFYYTSPQSLYSSGLQWRNLLLVLSSDLWQVTEIKYLNKFSWNLSIFIMIIIPSSSFFSNGNLFWFYITALKMKCESLKRRNLCFFVMFFLLEID